jgi:hypothetical protein
MKIGLFNWLHSYAPPNRVREILQELSEDLQNRGLAEDVDLIYQVNFFLTDKVKASQLECLHFIIEHLTSGDQ